MATHTNYFPFISNIKRLFNKCRAGEARGAILKEILNLI